MVAVVMDDVSPPCSTCNLTCYGYGCACNMTCYGHQSAVHYRVQIDGVAAPNTFKWSEDGGVSWDASTVPITGALQSLSNGVKIKFDSLTGHTNADYWDFYAGDGIFIGERLIWYYKNYGGVDLAQHSFHPGSPTQGVDSQLHFEVPEWNETMRNTAYSYFKLTYDANAWKSLSDFMIVAKGRKLLDPRNGATEFSRNPALVWLDFMKDARYGLGVPIASVDFDSVIDVANWCDDNDYYFDGIILDRIAFGDHMEQIMTNFRVFTIWSQGIYCLKVFADDASVMSLTEDDLEITPETFKIDVPGIPETPTSVKATFADKENFYTANFATRTDPAAVAASYTGDPTTLELTLIGTTSMAQAKKIAKYALLRNTFNKEFTFNAHPRAWVLEPGDMILVTHSFPGWTEKKLRIKSMNIPQAGVVTLNCFDEDVSIYDDSAD